MISLSNNIYKGGYMYPNSINTDARIIDTNEIMAARLETLAEILKAKETENELGATEFVQGLQPAEVMALLDDNEESGNVIKVDKTAEAENILQNAKDKASELISDAKKQADTIVSEALEQAAASKKNVLDEAQREGYREGLNRANREMEQLKAQLEQQAAQLREAYNARYETMESDLVETITDIYEHIFHIELSTHREILIYLINSTLRKQEGGRNFIVHVSKVDYPFVSSQKKQLSIGNVAGNTMDIIEDLTLAKGECFIETDGGIFDCGLGTQLQLLGRRLKLLSYEK